MNKTEVVRFAEDKESLKLLQQERLLLAVTELMQEAMDESETRRVDLARALGVSRGRITQILGGEDNLTLRTVADVFTAMGKQLAVTLDNLCIERDHWYYIGDSPNESVVPLRRNSWNVQLPSCDATELLAG